MEKEEIVSTASSVFTGKNTLTSGGITTLSGLGAAIAKIDFVTQIFLCIALISLLFTVFSFCVTWRYKYKADKRIEEQHRKAERRADELHKLEVLKKKAEINEYKR